MNPHETDTAPEVDNEYIAQIFDEIADLLEIMNESVFRIRAYRRGSDVLRTTPLPPTEVDENVSGIGKDLADKIREITETGECEMHQRLIEKVGPGILDILHIRGIGPKKVKLFYEQLQIDDLDKLKAAAESGALATLPRMGEKSEKAILEAINASSIKKERIPYDEALEIAEDYLNYMKQCKAVKEIAYAGSLRRGKATIGDIDILVAGDDAEAISEHFCAYKAIQKILAQGSTKSSVLLKGNKQIDLRVVKAESFGAALYYFTGPKHYNIYVRTVALRQGLKVNEYGLYRGSEKIAGRTEQEMVDGLGLEYLTPKEREDWT